MAKPWSFDVRAKRYRSGETGRFLAKAKVVAIRDTVVDAATREARSLAGQAAKGAISPETFRDGMRLAIRNAHGAEYIFGRGGIPSMTSADFGRLGAEMRRQFTYLDGFAREIEAGLVSEAQAAARAQMYVNGGTKAFELGQSAAWGIEGQLPLMPGDNCLGMSNCRCSWSIHETGGMVEATWKLGGANPCGPCQGNAARYAPLSIPARWAQPQTDPVRLSDVRRVA